MNRQLETEISFIGSAQMLVQPALERNQMSFPVMWESAGQGLAHFVNLLEVLREGLPLECQ